MRDYTRDLTDRRISNEVRDIIKDQYRTYVLKPFLNEVKMAVRKREIDEKIASEIIKYFERK